MSKDKWALEAGVLALFTLISVMIYVYSGLDTPPSIVISPTYEVSDIENIVEVTKLDHTRFDRDYAHHKFSGTMQLENVSEIQGTYVISFKKDSQSDFSQVMCRADQDFASNPVNAHVGKQVYVSGIINYAFMGSIALNNCEYAIVARK